MASAEILPSVNESDEEGDFIPVKPSSNYKRLLDSDSEDEIKNTSVISKGSTEESDNEDDDEPKERSRIVPQPDSSSADEEEEEMFEKTKVKDRRKNSNPKKKVIPVKQQRVSVEVSSKSLCDY